ncbi:hypothetical protein FACS1894199_13820 [Bacteroidia bacterium]|nr:hypothetical protein FACS1894199_13820 [Bacteroidia bacterium]
MADIATNVVKKLQDCILRRIMLIEEAIQFPSGTQGERVKTIVKNININKSACFSKPGKEAARRKNPNLFDMYPSIEQNGEELMLSWAFEQIWEYLIKISIIQQDTFKKVLVLLYRLCYFVDHQEFTGSFRYSPSKDILAEINNLENYVLKNGFKEKFDTIEIELLDFLYFVDLLAWNEDVKYNTTNGKAYFQKNKNGQYSCSANSANRGRVNTILSIISAPIMISKFINNIIESTKTNGIIDVKLITTTIQKFTKTRGLCILSNKELLSFLQPYLLQ